MSKTGPKTSPPTPLTGRSTPSRKVTACRCCTASCGSAHRCLALRCRPGRSPFDGDHAPDSRRGRQGSGGGGNTHVPTESRDTLRSKQIAHVIDLVSEGEIEGFSGDALQRIYLDDTPI